MAKQSKAQQDTVERVMHEYKEGDLKSSSGDKVESRKQAIAIALHEAGASRDETPAKNRQNLARTKRREARGETTTDRTGSKNRRSSDGPTKAELYEKAKTQDIPGRSAMSKAQLARAVKS